MELNRRSQATAGAIYSGCCLISTLVIFDPHGEEMAQLSETEVINHVRSDMAFIRGGMFRMGANSHYPVNSNGLHDTIGKVWEWTSDWDSAKRQADEKKACCIRQNPRGGSESASYDFCQPRIRIPRKILKSGSHLCAPNYCQRYRPAARHAEPIDTATSHVGLRCALQSAIKTHEGRQNR